MVSSAAIFLPRFDVSAPVLVFRSRRCLITSLGVLTWIRNADVFAPAPLGRKDLWIAGGRILAITGPGAADPPRGIHVHEWQADGLRVIPGLVDSHVHVTGGGGESGPETRVPPIVLTSLTTAGVTTCVGVLGTDGTTRTVRSLVARTYGLRAEGISAYCYTGSYEVPVPTLTGSVRDDIVFVDPIIGVGELAISDHRSSQPTFEELVRVAADCHVGGLMTGKAGILHLHLGDGKRGLSLLRRALDETELPARVFHPTHVNRQRWLFEEAIDLARKGATVDVTAFDPEDVGISVEDAIIRWNEEGLPPERLTVSSDGSGCLPTFNDEGHLIHMDVGSPQTVADALRTLLQRGHHLEHILPPFTQNPARLLRLHAKGEIGVDKDADLVFLDADGSIRHVMACGQWMVEHGNAVVLGTFERAQAAQHGGER